VHVQLGIDVADVSLGCAQRNDQLFRDLEIREPGHYQGEYLAFAVGEGILE
jgi:hypothetical protein